jgi:hypothetical protein
VNERTVAGTSIGAAFAANNPNVGTAITWALVSPPPTLPISIGLCDGFLKVKTPFQWKTATSYTMTVRATNNGAALGIGNATSLPCSVTVNVIQVRS